MRVIGGEFRSRRLESLPGEDVRPTPDKMRETLFNILGPAVAGSVFVDAYAGTGAVGIEALSRGARHVIFIEKNREAAEVIHRNLAALKAEARARVIKGASALYLGALDADFIFLDPPYPKEREYIASLDALAANRKALVIAQHSVRHALAENYDDLRCYRKLTQGDNTLSFYRFYGRPG